jgi:hypothetical protein
MNWASFRTALRDVVEDAWPEVTASGGGFIWTGPNIERVALEDLTEDDDDLTPTAVVQMLAPQVATEMVGIANHVWSVDLFIHYLRRRDNTATDWEEYLSERLAALQSLLLHTELAVGQVIDVTSLDVSEGNPLMALILDKNKPWVAGSLGVACEVGDSPT